MKNEKKKRKENVDKSTQVDDKSFVKRRRNVQLDKQVAVLQFCLLNTFLFRSDTGSIRNDPYWISGKEQCGFNIVLISQVQTDATFEKQLHEATKQLILDATREGQLHKTTEREARTSPIKTFAEPSTAIESTTLAERTTRFDESVAEEDGETAADDEQSSRAAFETPAKRSRVKAKSPARREWGSMRQRVLSLTQQVAALKATKESLTKSLNEQKFSNEKLQNDLNQSQQRGKLSKQAIEVIRNKFIS